MACGSPADVGTVVGTVVGAPLDAPVEGGAASGAGGGRSVVDEAGRDRRVLTTQANGISFWLTTLAEALENSVTEHLEIDGNTLAYDLIGQGPLVVLAH